MCFYGFLLYELITSLINLLDHIDLFEELFDVLLVFFAIFNCDDWIPRLDFHYLIVDGNSFGFSL